MLYRGRTEPGQRELPPAGRGQRQLTQLPGVKARKESLNALDVMSVEILDQTGARALGKPIGKYFTLTLPDSSSVGRSSFSDLVKALSELIGRCAGDFDSVLVAAWETRTSPPTPWAVSPPAHPGDPAPERGGHPRLRGLFPPWPSAAPGCWAAPALRAQSR